MRRFFSFLAVSVLAVVSCSKVEPEIIEYDADLSVPQTITALISDDEPLKTVLGDTWQPEWASGDKISVFITRSSNNTKYFGHSEFSYKGGGQFSGTVDKKFATPYNWLAIYPYSNYGSTMSGIFLSITHPEILTQQGSSKSHISGSAAPMWGYALNTQNNPVIPMHQIASVLVFHVKNGTPGAIRVTDVKFTAPSAITGQYTASVDIKNNYKGTAPVWNASSSASKTVEVKVEGASKISSNQVSDVYAAIHPISGSGKYTVEVTAVSGSKLLIFTKTIDTDLTFSAGKYKEITVEFSNPEEINSANIENPSLKKYLDMVEKTPYFTDDVFHDWTTTYYSGTYMTSDVYGSNSSSNRLDQPAPVELLWEGSATGLDIYSDSGFTEKVSSLSFSAGESARIYNLIPGKQYWFKAVDGNSTVDQGSFTPEGRRRMMRVSTTYDRSYAANCRDLGGLKTLDGKQLKYGLIYRGTNIDNILKDAAALDVFLNTMHITLDVDLRNTGEKNYSPDLKIYGINRTPQDYDSQNHVENLQKAEKVRGTLDSVMTHILKDQPVYIHCAIGSDRTGYICFLIESLIGVRQNWTDTDYEITSFASSVVYGARLRTEPSGAGGQYKTGLKFLSQFSGTTLHDKVYDYVVTSENGLKMDKNKVDSFISKMKE